MRELEKVNLIRCKQCGMLHGEEVKHKCDNIRKAAYRQGKADMAKEIILQLKGDALDGMIFGVLLTMPEEEREELKKKYDEQKGK